MTPDLAIGHALGALVLVMAKGMAAVAIALVFVFICGILDGFYHERRARRWTDPSQYRDKPGIWQRSKDEDDPWRRGNGVDY